MDPIANPLFNDQVATTLINNGYAELGIFFVIAQIFLIPMTVFIWKQYIKKQDKHAAELDAAQKKVIDAERAATALERNAQIIEMKTELAAVDAKYDARIILIEKDVKHEMQEMKESQTRLNKTLERLFDRIDEMCAKINELWFTRKKND
jgi:cell division protein FtsI/penicillin-binding protein 2